MPFTRILVANRGVAAVRILRTTRRLSISSVAIATPADRYAVHTQAADEVVPVDSYLDAAAVIAAAHRADAEAIHPGYGFLAEHADFAEACIAAGLVFIGPTPAQIRAFGLKHRARALARAAGVKLAPGSDLLADAQQALVAAGHIGYPVMLKSTAGGGGIGLALCRTDADLVAAFQRVSRLAAAHFGDAGLYIERHITRARHVEVQIFGDGRGRVEVLGDRDCSAQRRHQKIIEEAPAADLAPALRDELHAAAQRLCRSVNYANAGTVEFMYDTDAEECYFLEVNTRLQVEHGVTEALLGIDLVEWMLRQAAGEAMLDPPKPAGPRHAIEVRLYAEDPARDFQPCAGRLIEVAWPDTARVDTCVTAGTDVSPAYDPMLATLIVSGADRASSLEALATALDATRLTGIETNIRYLRFLLRDRLLVSPLTTATLAGTVYDPPRVDVLAPGTQTTVQAWPGRLGLWHVGVPPSGPMDERSVRLANRAVGNAPGAPGLEIVVSGPTLRFHGEHVICVTGAALPCWLNERAVPLWEPLRVADGSVLRIGSNAPAGCRSYLALRGGLDVPEVLGSAATFALGGFGGQAGRALVAGDTLYPADRVTGPPAANAADERPLIGTHWDITVLDGPHGAPDFFTDDDIAAFYDARWTVHYNSDRTGVRLIGPRPTWARADGGEAGLHPSNIHDTPYAIGAIDYTGDMPIILGPDGPSLGGFVCPATIIRTELWKTGQLRAGDTVRFCNTHRGPAVLDRRAATRLTPEVVYRRAGDANLLIEYGPPILDLTLRFRVHALMQALHQADLPGVIDLTPGIRSLQIHFDPAEIGLPRVLAEVQRVETALSATDDITVPSRTVQLPLSWDDPATRLAIERYMRSVRPDAPWCPSNIEFIRRINGLDTVEDVKRIVYAAEYLVLGLGDVYLGAPVATPLDPRHRLVTTKYNPARTWTPENAVGIGGAYLCVYGMEGPGGYQFVGRTCQVWNHARSTVEFPAGQPWLLRFFDRIRFYEVDAQALLDFRQAFAHGAVSLPITEGTFRLRDYHVFLAANADSIAAFKLRQQSAFEAERARWTQLSHDAADSEFFVPEVAAPDADAITSPVSGGVWKLLVAPGDTVEPGQVLVIVEAMKTEISVAAPCAGVIDAVSCREGIPVAMGQALLRLRR